MIKVICQKCGREMFEKNRIIDSNIHINFGCGDCGQKINVTIGF